MIERAIFTYWEQGFDHAPPLVGKCLQQMRRLNPTWTIHALDGRSISPWVGERFVPEGIWEKLGRAHRSDLLRTQLLIRYGGVWMDPTVFCVRSLDDWLPDAMRGGLFLFRKPGLDRLISNWFIAAEPENLVLQRLLARLLDYWSWALFEREDKVPGAVEKFLIRLLNRHHRLSRLRVRAPWRNLFSESPYMVYHYLLCDLVLTDREAKAIWQQVPVLPAAPPHKLQDLGLCSPAGSEVEGLLAGRLSPVFKLTWKDVPAEPEKGTILARLFQIADGRMDVPA